MDKRQSVALEVHEPWRTHIKEVLEQMNSLQNSELQLRGRILQIQEESAMMKKHLGVILSQLAIEGGLPEPEPNAPYRFNDAGTAIVGEVLIPAMLGERGGNG
jgi:hypothetical protein